jgi:hypothetical protein
MIREIIERMQFVSEQSLMAYFVIACLVYLAIYYTFTICHFILSHRWSKITNLVIIIIITALSLLPEINILILLIFLPFIIAITIGIKLAFIIIIIFDVDVHNKSLCLIIKTIINNIINSSFRLM